ncbi:hypothetical protein COCVIDRAFT_36160 [Bipolaris victoriae FI3]|uniref:SMP domain-containing protein n=1 Tax=Bipolaris victoriae (strain FI3) TaxID=930091 RepID=W7EL81_BIPV3|nr:hypothetical protein COCVIDRAFT_36160 [Bipolaris victoriae FI3]
MFSDTSSLASSQSSQFKNLLEAMLEKLKTDPSSVTVDDARLLFDNFTASDERAVRIISAVEYLAIANKTHHCELLTAVKDLHDKVESSPGEVTIEVLRTTQSVVSKMQKALGHTNVPHPEVEGELQEEIAKIEPKIVQGTVTKAEADRLHSLESRAYGHTEKGGITAAAQSVVARRERQLSLSGGPKALQPSEKLAIRPKIQDDSKNTLSPQEQSHHDKEENFRQAELAIQPKIQDSTVTPAEANKLHSCEMRAHGHTEKGGLAATAQSVVSHRQRTLSDISNSPHPSETDAGPRKEDTAVNKELKKVEGDLGDVRKAENEAQ